MTQGSSRKLSIAHLHEKRGPDPALAVILEFIPGLFVQTFGIGNIYAGKTGRGILLMVGYWMVLAVSLSVLGIPDGLGPAGAGFAVFLAIATRMAFSAARERQKSL